MTKNFGDPPGAGPDFYRWDSATWPTYDRALHDDLVKQAAFALGLDWLEGEDVPGADDLLNDVEQTLAIALPESGSDLDRLRRQARTAWRAGKND